MRFKNLFKKDEGGNWIRHCIKIYESFDLIEQTLNNYSDIIIKKHSSSNYTIKIKCRKRNKNVFKCTVPGKFESYQITLSFPYYNYNIIKDPQIKLLLSIISNQIHNSNIIEEVKNYTFNVEVDY